MYIYILQKSSHSILEEKARESKVTHRQATSAHHSALLYVGRLYMPTPLYIRSNIAIVNSCAQIALVTWLRISVVSIAFINKSFQHSEENPINLIQRVIRINSLKENGSNWCIDEESKSTPT